MGAAAQTEGEINQFGRAVDAYHLGIAATVEPLGLGMDGKVRGHVYSADSSQHGDLLVGIWEIGMGGVAPIHCFSDDPVNRPLCAIYGLYRQCAIAPMW